MPKFDYNNENLTEAEREEIRAEKLTLLVEYFEKGNNLESFIEAAGKYHKTLEEDRARLKDQVLSGDADMHNPQIDFNEFKAMGEAPAGNDPLSLLGWVADWHTVYAHTGMVMAEGPERGPESTAEAEYLAVSEELEDLFLAASSVYEKKTGYAADDFYKEIGHPEYKTDAPEMAEEQLTSGEQPEYDADRAEPESSRLNEYFKDSDNLSEFIINYQNFGKTMAADLAEIKEAGLENYLKRNPAGDFRFEAENFKKEVDNDDPHFLFDRANQMHTLFAAIQYCRQNGQQNMLSAFSSEMLDAEHFFAEKLGYFARAGYQAAESFGEETANAFTEALYDGPEKSAEAESEESELSADEMTADEAEAKKPEKTEGNVVSTGGSAEKAAEPAEIPEEIFNGELFKSEAHFRLFLETFTEFNRRRTADLRNARDLGTDSLRQAYESESKAFKMVSGYDDPLSQIEAVIDWHSTYSALEISGGNTPDYLVNDKSGMAVSFIDIDVNLPEWTDSARDLYVKAGMGSAEDFNRTTLLADVDALKKYLAEHGPAVPHEQPEAKQESAPEAENSGVTPQPGEEPAAEPAAEENAETVEFTKPAEKDPLNEARVIYDFAEKYSDDDLVLGDEIDEKSLGDFLSDSDEKVTEIADVEKFGFFGDERENEVENEKDTEPVFEESKQPGFTLEGIEKELVSSEPEEFANIRIAPGIAYNPGFFADDQAGELSADPVVQEEPQKTEPEDMTVIRADVDTVVQERNENLNIAQKRSASEERIVLPLEGDDLRKAKSYTGEQERFAAERNVAGEELKTVPLADEDLRNKKNVAGEELKTVPIAGDDLRNKKNIAGEELKTVPLAGDDLRKAKSYTGEQERFAEEKNVTGEELRTAALAGEDLRNEKNVAGEVFYSIPAHDVDESFRPLSESDKLTVDFLDLKYEIEKTGITDAGRISNLEEQKQAIMEGPDGCDPASMMAWISKWRESMDLVRKTSGEDLTAAADSIFGKASPAQLNLLKLGKSWLNIHSNYRQYHEQLFTDHGADTVKDENFRAELETFNELYDESLGHLVSGRDMLPSALGSTKHYYHDFKAFDVLLNADEKYVSPDNVIIKTRIMKQENQYEAVSGVLNDLEKSLKATDPWWLLTNSSKFRGLKAGIAQAKKAFEKAHNEPDNSAAREEMYDKMAELAETARDYARGKANWEETGKARDYLRFDLASKIGALAEYASDVPEVYPTKVYLRRENAPETISKLMLGITRETLKTDAASATPAFKENLAEMFAMTANQLNKAGERFPACKDLLAIKYLAAVSEYGNFMQNEKYSNIRAELSTRGRKLLDSMKKKSNAAEHKPKAKTNESPAKDNTIMHI